MQYNFSFNSKSVLGRKECLKIKLVLCFTRLVGKIKDPAVQWVYATESCYLPSPCLLLFPSDVWLAFPMPLKHLAARVCLSAQDGCLQCNYILGIKKVKRLMRIAVILQKLSYQYLSHRFPAPVTFCTLAWVQSSHLSRVGPHYRSTGEIFPGNGFKSDFWESSSSGVMQNTTEECNGGYVCASWGLNFLQKLSGSGVTASPAAKIN